MKRLVLVALALLTVGCSDAKSANEPLESVAVQTETVETLPYDFGVAITLENLTPSGTTAVLSQSGGEVTGELMCGSAFTLEKEVDGAVWLPVESAVPADQIAFTAEAYFIPLGAALELEINWEHLYGELPAGTYRLGKSIMDFRGTGDYDEQIYYAEFTL